MAINSSFIIEKLTDSLERISASVESLNEEVLSIDTEKPLSIQIEQTERMVRSIESVIQVLSEENNNTSHLLINDVLASSNQKLQELRQKHLEEETDTPREAAENIKKYIENPSDPGLLLSALKWIKTLVPPTIEEFETIPYETARINDSDLVIGEEFIETSGVNGEVKITYELTEDNEGQEVKTEIKREVVTEMVREIIRVGTKEIEPEEIPDEPEGDLEEPGE